MARHSGMRTLIATIRAVLVLLMLAAAAPVRAADYVDGAALDELFSELRSASSADEARDVVAQIWDIWFHPAVPDLAERMQQASAASGRGDFAAALDILGGIVADYPDYSEGWNQRATLYYELGNFEASLADIDKVLALEPRHFGALSGRVLIYLKQGKRAEALKDMIAALAIDPYLDEKKLFPELSPDTTSV
jgi:tetratricopeptide (TPR) repeat protein